MNTKLVTVAAPRGGRTGSRDMITKRVVLCSASSMLRASDIEAVDLAGQFGGDRGDRGVAKLLDLGGAAGGVGAHDRLEAARPEKLRHCDSAWIWLRTADAVETGAGQRQQMVVHPLEMLADDVEA